MKATSQLLLLALLPLANAFSQCKIACDSASSIWGQSSKSDVALFRVVKAGKVGYIDPTGKLVIPHQFDLDASNLGDFTEGLAPVRLDTRWGFIDPNGSFG